ncbi:hypothetical protein [Fluviicola sp.]|uniref:hypothetical protein n=1 Tax=Fluviicola sp. TaxID=1917219 RepID=UPI0031D3A2C2
MRTIQFPVLLIIILTGFLISCEDNTPVSKQPAATEATPGKDSLIGEQKSSFESLLNKYRTISFDTLKVYYGFDENDKRFAGQELTFKEAKSLPIGFRERYFGKLSGVYACYRFALDSTRLGLITRIPSEYESSSLVLLVFDRIKDRFQDEYFYLGTSNGDAGEIYTRVSWLFQTKKKQFQAFVYTYRSSHEIDDTLTTESHYYFLVDCMKPTFDSVSTNQTQLKKRFKGLLRTEEEGI